MDLRAINVGAEYTGTLLLKKNWFMRGNIMGAYGKVDYSSYTTETIDGQKNWYIDARVLFGKDYLFDRFILAYYSGLGYRFLYHDFRGITSTGARGYRRKSNYLYLPIGVEYTVSFLENSKFITNLEFDLLLIGRQKSYRSDIGPSNSDITNKQTRGFAARLNFKYRINFCCRPISDLLAYRQFR